MIKYKVSKVMRYVMKSGNEKLLGGIGSILVLLSPIPVVGLILSLVGFVLVLIALKGISDKANNSKIFTNAIISVVLVAISFIVGIMIFIPSIIALISGNTVAMKTGFIGIMLSFVVVYVLIVTGFILFRNTLKLVANFTGVSLFNTAGTMFFIGSILMIILIGSILMFIGWILLAIAFFSIPDEYKNVEST